MFQGELMSSDIKMPLKKKSVSLKLKRAHVELPHTSLLCVIRGRGEGGRGKG